MNEIRHKMSKKGLYFARSLSFIPWVLIPSEATFRALCTVPPLPGNEKSQYLCCAICLTNSHTPHQYDLTASEVKCLQLKSKRKLNYYCESCEEGLSKVPVLIKEVAELRECINCILNKDSFTNAGSSTNIDKTSHDMEITVAEVMERQERASNLIIYNVNESVKPTHADRNSEDREAVKLGKNSSNRARPIKVILKTSGEAKQVLRDRNLIKTPGIKIYGDQTKAQREYFKKIKAELERIVADGDNTKTIRYINNVPTIASKDSFHRTKN
ncbi:unnamed protein product [Callosobruchus maculatus]|uniref:Uncharacterized protein n=1 Tax=Callosobruchus maculatus TaxID=64391 RepID=A0A653C360_CALMS|nr:unnamed protein product [Callosobruchus maculatus]